MGLLTGKNDWLMRKGREPIVEAGLEAEEGTAKWGSESRDELLQKPGEGTYLEKENRSRTHTKIQGWRL